MGTVTKIKVGSHYDPNDGWAREPKLSGVIDIRDREERMYQRSVAWVRGCAYFGAGYLFSYWLWA